LFKEELSKVRYVITELDCGEKRKQVLRAGLKIRLLTDMFVSRIISPVFGRFLFLKDCFSHSEYI